jgi:histidine triad (HIT) family protein
MQQRLRRLALQIARSRAGGALLRLGFSSMSFLIPVERLRETPTLLAFYHPSPGYPVHILIVPRRAYRTLLDIPATESGLMSDLLETVQSLVRELGLDAQGYRLIVNGGSYQEVPVLHFHLISEGDAH